METQRIMVTGGSGFIGTNLCNELRRRGHEVLSVDLLHHEDEADLYSDSYADYVRGDIRSYRQMERIFEENDKFDYVYNLAAEYGRWNGEAYYENLWQTNVIGLKNMIRLQEKLGFRMISFSSAEVYGDYDGIMSEDVMEKNPIADTYQMNDYAISKWAGELMCMNSATMFGTDIKQYSDLVLEAVGVDDSLVTYTPAEEFTTKVKTIDFSKAIRDLKHDPKIDPKEGIKRTVEWMKWYYRIE